MTVSEWLSSNTAVWLVQSLAHVLWQGTELLVVASAADALIAKRSSQVRYGLWLGTLLLMFCCLPVNLLVLAPRDAEPPEDTTGLIAPAGVPGRWTSESVVATDSTGSEVRHAEVDDIAANHQQAGSVDIWHQLAPYVFSVYVCGVGMMLMRLLLAAGAIRRLRRSAAVPDDAALLRRIDALATQIGLQMRPIVATSARVAVPVVVGVIRPVILLPACVLSGLEPAQLEAVLLHELAHIRRRDPLVNLLQRCVETVLFFQPAVWIASRRVRVLREDCCDDVVLQCDVPQCLYAESLVAVSELRSGRTSGQTLVLAAVDPAERSLR